MNIPQQLLTETAETVLARRYYLKDGNGTVLENWETLCRRVADAVAEVDSDQEDYPALREAFFEIICQLDFLPNSPCLMNAGTDLGQLSACFVLPVEDSMDGIFTSIRNGALVHKTGGGTGYSFSRLRPKNSAVRSTQGVASGPLSFAAVFDAATETIKQGGKRRGANMGVLRVDHPDILDFITAKEDQTRFTNFNFSVAITDTFMEAVKNNQEYDLIDPSENKVVNSLNATKVFEKIIDLAWHNGEPGVLFIDAANRVNATPQLGDFEATNPCVTGDTWVMTGQGPRQVDELIGHQCKLTVNGEPWNSSEKGFFTTGTKEIFTLRTNEGFMLKLTADHPVRKVVRKTRWVLESDWLEAGELAAGDEILLHDHRSLTSWPGQGTEEEGYLLGLLLGDGTLKPEAAVLSVWTAQAVNGGEQPGPLAIMQEVERCCAVALTHRADFSGFHAVTGRDEWRLQSAPLRDLSLSLGMAPQNKVITPAVEQTSSSFHQGFLRGLFDADGSVQGEQRKGVSVRLAQSCRDTLEAVQRMLLRLGIVSNLFVRRAPGMKELPDGRGGSKKYPVKEQFELIISRENLLTFADRVGFSDTEKQAKLQVLLASFKRSLNRERFTVRVESVESAGMEQVYDVQVPGINAFDANGFYVHNCGEQWLLPYESCNLGSINLGHYVQDKKVDFERLDKTVKTAVRFLDNVIDCNRFPIPEIGEMTLKTRKIGLGVMGLHDMLIQMELAYGSEEGREASAEVMRFIRDQAEAASVDLAKLKGPFPAYDPEVNQYPARRNAALTSIQPTGTVSMIADCASGCEPYFSVVMEKNVMDGDKFLMVNKHFEAVARQEGFFSEALMKKVAQSGTVVGHNEIPKKWQNIFCTAQDIAPEEHIWMQGALQVNGVDASISKTINLPASATKEDVRFSYMLGFELGCKGLTVYRDGSRDAQVLNTVGTDNKNTKTATVSGQGILHKTELPDVLNAKRYRLKDANGNTIYIIVCFAENETPMEVFAKFPFDNRVDLKDKSTMWTTTCRLVSLALRYQIPMEEVIKQLDRSSGHMLDLPAQLGKLLKSFMAGTRNGFSSACPECSGKLVFEEGCEACRECGYSKCS